MSPWMAARCPQRSTNGSSMPEMGTRLFLRVPAGSPCALKRVPFSNTWGETEQPRLWLMPPNMQLLQVASDVESTLPVAGRFVGSTWTLTVPPESATGPVRPGTTLQPCFDATQMQCPASCELRPVPQSMASFMQRVPGEVDAWRLGPVSAQGGTCCFCRR